MDFLIYSPPITPLSYPMESMAMTQTLQQPPSPRSLSLPLLEVKNLRTHFPIRKGFLRSVAGYVTAVEEGSVEVHSGETLGLVGESGCGKTTVGRTILRLIEPKGGVVVSGQTMFDGKDVFTLPAEEMRKLRREMQIVFQDPVGSLNPRMTIGSMLSEPMLVHGLVDKSGARQRVAQLLDRVGLASATANRYPHGSVFGRAAAADWYHLPQDAGMRWSQSLLCAMSR